MVLPCGKASRMPLVFKDEMSRIYKLFGRSTELWPARFGRGVQALHVAPGIRSQARRTGRKRVVRWLAPWRSGRRKSRLVPRRD